MEFEREQTLTTHCAQAHIGLHAVKYCQLTASEISSIWTSFGSHRPKTLISTRAPLDTVGSSNDPSAILFYNERDQSTTIRLHRRPLTQLAPVEY